MGAKLARLLIGIVIIFWIGFFGFKMLKNKAGQDTQGMPLSERLMAVLGKKPAQAPQAKLQETPAPIEQPLPLARTLRLKPIDFKDMLPVMGTVKGETEISLGFEVPGVVEKIYFREGEKVKKGDMIASLDTRDAQLRITHSQNKLNSAIAAYNSALKQLEIHKKLYEVGALIKSKMEQIELEVESARFQTETARTEFEIAKKELDKSYIYAAKDGVMGPRKAEEGEYVSPQDKLGWLLEIGNVFIEVGVVERDIDKVKIGQKAKIYVDAYQDRFFEGAVQYIFPVVEGKSRTLTVKIKVENAEGALKPGMFSRADLSLVELQNALIVPASAVINLEGTHFLSLIPAESIQGTPEETQTGTAAERRVQIGYFTSDYAQITSGADPGDLVILETQGEVKDGTKVKIVGIEELSL